MSVGGKEAQDGAAARDELMVGILTDDKLDDLVLLDPVDEKTKIRVRFCKMGSIGGGVRSVNWKENVFCL